MPLSLSGSRCFNYAESRKIDEEEKYRDRKETEGESGEKGGRRPEPKGGKKENKRLRTEKS